MPQLTLSKNNFDSEIRLRIPDFLRKTLEMRAQRMKVSLSEYARTLLLMVSGAFDQEIDRVSKIQPKEKLSEGVIQDAIKKVRQRST